MRGQSDLYLLTDTGQVYKVAWDTFGDTTTRTGSVQPVGVTIRGRGLTGAGFQVQGVCLSAAVVSLDADRLVTFYVRGGYADTNHRYHLQPGETAVQVEAGGNACGRLLQWEMQAQGLRLSLRRVELKAVQRARL